MTLAWADRAAVLAADQAVNNFGDTRGGAFAGPMGLFLILVLLLVTVLLIRNMSKRIRRLPREFPDAGEEARRAAPVSPAPDDGQHRP
ncbi:MAG TPA: hypothetical protein VGD72_04950 [Mycobacteriales bacterium]|jgi:hypothetical protein